ncbi:alpha/beta hydrolase [Amycolatopsis stemonae]
MSLSRRFRVTAVAVLAAVAGFPATAAASGPALAWGPCAGVPEPSQGLQCTSMSVPLDYARPGGQQITLAFSRLPAADPAKRRGVLLLNPGSQGDSQLSLPLQLIALGLPQSVRDTYDLVAFDPRGAGNSTRVTCDLPVTFMIPPAYAVTNADVDKQAGVARQNAQGCAAAPSAPLLPYITVRNVARDLDGIRAALGERKVSFLGYSFGAFLGATYATMYPARTDRFVLDSSTGPNGLDFTWSRRFAPGLEKHFPDFAAWAASQNATYGLGSTPEAVKAKYFELAAKLDQTPIETVDGATFRWINEALTQSDATFPLLAQVYQQAADGTISRPPLPPGFDFSGLLSIVCNMDGWPTDVEVYRRAVNHDRAAYPLLGAAAANVWACAFWPARKTEPQVRIGDHGPSNILMVQNLRDNGTDYPGGVEMRRALGDRARLVTVDQGGHRAYLFGTNACANATVARWLADGVRPAADTTCPA